MTNSQLSRRGFLAVSGAGAAAVVVAACSSDDNTTATSGASTSSSSAASASSGSAAGDAKVAMTAASLEVLAVGTYKAALNAATGGALGAVPPAVATFVQTAMKQHQAALDEWNKVLTSGGAQAVSTPPADLKATIDGEFAKVKDVVAAAKLALLLEQTASDTYLKVMPTLQSGDAITLAGALQISGQEHAAILHYVLGEYPVPDVFQKTNLAYTG